MIGSGPRAPSIGTAIYSDGVVHSYMCLWAKDRAVVGAPICGKPSLRAEGEARDTDGTICADCRARARKWLEAQAAKVGVG